MSSISPVRDRFAAELTELATLTDSSRPGWTRRAMSQQDVAGRDFARTLMKQAGLDTRIDGAGNVIGVLRGRLGGREIMLGSHTDTVDGGGRFDGITGVLGAIEIAHLLRENDIRLDHDLVIVVFFNEEPNDFGFFCVGSRAMTGLVDTSTLAATDPTGLTLAEALPASAIDPEEFLRARYDFRPVTAFLELHIEQGPELERAGKQIGVVETITSTIASVADDLGLSRATMFSGAGHDAGIIAAQTQVGMIFVPSADGRSHCPEEFTDFADIMPGVSVLFETVLRIDRLGQLG